VKLLRLINPIITGTSLLPGVGQ